MGYEIQKSDLCLCGHQKEREHFYFPAIYHRSTVSSKNKPTPRASRANRTTTVQMFTATHLKTNETGVKVSTQCQNPPQPPPHQPHTTEISTATNLSAYLAVNQQTRAQLYFMVTRKSVTEHVTFCHSG